MIEAATTPPVSAGPLVIGVTSHRNICGNEEGAVRERIRQLFAKLRDEFPGMPLVLLSSLAEGGDQWAAEEALLADIRLVAPLPMARALYAEDFPGESERAHFDALCNRAEVIELPGIDDLDQQRSRAPESASERDRCYANAGVYVSAHCHILLAIWDGKASDRLGGTAQIARYHLLGIEPAAIERRRNPARNPIGNDNERLMFHIVCSRDEPGGSPAAPLRPLQVCWRFDEVTMSGETSVPSEFHAMFAHMAEFNADWAKYREPIDARAMGSHYSRSASATQASESVDPSGRPRQRAEAQRAGQESQMPQPGVVESDPIDIMFNAADWLAIHFQRRVLFAMRAIYVMAGLMGIAFMAYADFPAQDYMIFVFLCLFAFGVWLSVLASRRGWHRKYIDYRALAEGLRVQSYWRRAGLSVTGDAEFAHDNFLQKQDVELGWIRNLMRAAGLLGDLRAQPVAPNGLSEVIAEWVGESGKSGQLHYFERRADQRMRMHHLTELFGKVSLWLGISISVFLAIFFASLDQDTKTSLVATMAIASIVAAVRESYAYRKADKELIKQYRFMCRIFSGARSALDRTHDPAEQRDILRVLGETALAEHAEWTLMHRERPLEHARL